MAGDLSLHEAAERLGVHYMTAYRYVRTGRLPGHKVGPEWRVDPDDLAAFAAAGSPGGARRRTAPWSARLHERLVAADEPGAWQVVQQALASGTTPEGLYFDVLAPALVSVGDGWAAGEVSVGEEHQATAVAVRLIGRLGPLFARPGRKRGTVVLGMAPGDAHGAASALLADPVRGRGFAVIDLGANTPGESFAEAARRADRLVAVGINATTIDNDEAVAAAIDTIHRAIDVPVVLGGGAVPDEEAAGRLGADRWAADGREALAVFEALAGARRVKRR